MNELLFIILDIFWIGFWFWVGTKLFSIFKSKSKDDALLRDSLIEKVETKQLYTLKTEVHNDMIFAFTADTDTFISQGKSIEEVAEVAHKHRKVELAYVLHEKEFMWFVDGKVTKTVKLL